MPSSKRSAFKGLKILVTSGPASVPIDDMRVITNRSTGEMGRLLANAFVKANARVTMLEGAVTTQRPLPAGVKVKTFFFYNELTKLLNMELRNSYDLIVHAAAVPDFSLKRVFKGKLSSAKQLQLDLVPNPKLINTITKRAPASRLVGFKFEPAVGLAHPAETTASLFNEARCDLVVLNKNDAQGYAACIILSNGVLTKTVHSKQALVNLLLKHVIL